MDITSIGPQAGVVATGLAALLLQNADLLAAIGILVASYIWANRFLNAISTPSIGIDTDFPKIRMSKLRLNKENLDKAESDIDLGEFSRSGGPIKVAFIKGKPHVMDGYHRYVQAKRAGKTEIEYTTI